MFNVHFSVPSIYLYPCSCQLSGMSYVCIKTIGGKQYRYLQTSYRVGKKVKTKSVYLGRVGGGLFTPIPREEQGLRYIGRLIEKYPSPPAEHSKGVSERRTAETGLKMSPDDAVPVEKVGFAPSVSAPASVPQAEQSAGKAGAFETSSESA